MQHASDRLPSCHLESFGQWGPANMRIVIALAVIISSGWTAAAGWNIVCFSHATAVAASSEDRRQAVRSWIAAPGLSGTALQASLTDAPDPRDIDQLRRRRDHLAAILSVRPMSSINWLMLASMRFASGQPFDKVLAALQMSSLTGANEGHVVSQRGIFGLWLWEKLPPQVRRQTVSGLAAALVERAISDQERAIVDRILATKSADTRQEIADLARAEGLSASDLKRIGL